MSLSEATAVEHYIAAGGTAFDFGFEISNQAFLGAMVGSVLQTFGTHYTVSGINNSNGGTVTFITAPAVGAVVTLFRRERIDQPTAYLLNEAYNALKVQVDLDHQASISQMLAERVGRAIKFEQESTYIDIPIEDPVASQILRWNGTADAIESVDIATIDPDSIVATLTAGRIVFATGTTAIDTDANLLWDDSLLQLNVGTTTRATLNATGVMNSLLFFPNDTAYKSGAAYFRYSDPGSHTGEIHTSVAVVAQPLGSGILGPPSLDAGLTVSTMKQNFFGPSLEIGEITGAYFVVRQGSAGDSSGILLDVAAYNNPGFSCMLEGHTIEFNAGGIQQRIVDVQMGVIDTGNGNFMGLYITCDGGCSDGLRVDSISPTGGWTNGLNLTNGDYTNAIAIKNQGHIGWMDTVGTIRGVVSAFGDNTIHFGWHTAPATNGQIVFIHGATEIARFAPVAAAASDGLTNFYLTYHNGTTQVFQQVSLAADVGGFRALRVPA